LFAIQKNVSFFTPLKMGDRLLLLRDETLDLGLITEKKVRLSTLGEVKPSTFVHSLD
jgi:hypothetical protein